MEPNKLDSIIKEKLEARKIQPSAQAWDRLDAMLTATEKPKRSFTWMYIAASFIGFLIVGTIFFNGFGAKIISTTTPVVLEQKLDRNTIEEQKVNIKDTTTSISTKSLIRRKEVVAENNNLNRKPTQLVNKNKEVSVINQNKSENNQNNVPVPLVAEKASNNAINTLLGSIESKMVKENQIGQKQSVSVNSNNLLSQVDNELEPSFREKVIVKINKNYQTVKVALANRNLE
ncbi:hypothetical protein AB3G34_11575 [Flavobacterium sp. WC2409]|uniref:Anti-sigma factor n=1 Tax=Flavobacterium sp. WC2409 TaxID=3234139 RepID=A0AB39W1W7_9FLAO